MEEWNARVVREAFELIREWFVYRQHQEVEIEVNALELRWVVSKVGLERVLVSHRGA